MASVGEARGASAERAVDAAGSARARRERPGKVAILRAAVTVMGEDGYEGASMRDMATRAGVSVAALYYHFPSKHDLLLEFLDEAYDVILRRVDRRLIAAEPTATARLDELVGTLIASYVHDDYAVLASTVALREYTRLEPEARAAIDVKRQRIFDRVRAVVEEGVETGEFDVDHPADVAFAIAGLCASVIEPWHQMGRRMGEVIELFQGFARSLVGAPKAPAPHAALR